MEIIMEQVIPSIGEMNEAKLFPNGWIYRINEAFIDREDIPAEAVIGAWKVDSFGVISGNFIYNPNYSEEKCLVFLNKHLN